MRRLTDDGFVLDALVVIVQGATDSVAVSELGDAALAATFERAFFSPLGCIREGMRTMVPRKTGTILVVTEGDDPSVIKGTAAARATGRALSGLLEVAAHEVGRDGVMLNGLRVGGDVR